MSELYGDAFKDDKREERLFGDDVTEPTTTIVFDSSKDLPESKSNNVSFMKVEDLPLDCRNVLAVSETHICYSVTQKKNLLRVIDTQLGEKVILRGHEHSVHDLRFAATDSAVLCSVDSGEGSKAHTIVWKKQEQGDWKIHAELSLRATTVRPHPVQSDLWLVACPSSLGIFSARANPSLAVAAGSYEALPLHLVLVDNETIVDVTFSSSGKHVAVAVSRDDQSTLSHIRIFKVDEGQGLVRVQTLRPLADFSCPNLLALRWTQGHIVTVSALHKPSAADTVNYQVDMWYSGLESKDGAHSVPPLSVQTLTLVLPRATAGSASSGLANPSLECALSLEPRAERYLLLSSRRSSLVACLALNPHPSVAGQPVYHVTCLNLRAPVVSADVITVLGQAHHSAEAGEHLEVSAYQEAASDAGQASIQQYHVLFAHLFDFAAYSALPDVKAQKSHDEGADGSAAGGGLIPLAALLEGSPTKQRIKENSNLSAASEASNNKGMTILNMLNSMQRSTSNGSLASASAVTTPSALPSPGIVRPQPSSASPATPAASSAAAGKLLGLLNSGSKKNNTEVQSTGTSASPATTDGLPSFLLNTQPSLNSSILDVLKAASAKAGASAPVTPAAPASAALSTPNTARPAVATPAALPVQPVVSQVAPAAAPAPVAPKSTAVPAQRPQPSAAAAVETVKPTPIRPAAGSVVAPVAVKATTSAAPAVGGDSQLEQLTAAVRELQLTVANIAGAQQQSQSDASGTKALQQAVRELQAGQSKHSEQLLAAVRKAMEGEAKRAHDHSTASSGTMRVEMSEQIVKELVPAISSKVRDSVRDTVRDSLKAQLPGAFRESFEAGMLPAFEAGAQAMFQQLQAAFVQGMQGVMQEGLRAQSAAAASTDKLEQEVRELRETVGRLEGSVVALSATVQSLTHSLASASAQQLDPASVAEAPAQDAFSLLREGRISEAVVRVLEDKDIAVTVSLLELLTPAQVASSCSHLERLCITQQLAADMSVNIPLEGIGKRVDWIKNLVLSLLTGKQGGAQGGIYEDPNYELHFKNMISVVLDSISAAKKLIFSAQYDTGEDDALSNLQVPHSVGTDLQLLEYVIQSKM